jgi:VIT family
MDGFVSAGALATASVSARTAGEKSGSSGREHEARRHGRSGRGLAAWAIAMGLGAIWRPGRMPSTTTRNTRERNGRPSVPTPAAPRWGPSCSASAVEMEEVASIFRSYGLPETTVTTVAQAIGSDRRRWVEFMMKFELRVDKPDRRGLG